MYTLAFATRAKKSMRKYQRSGSFPLAKFKDALEHLRSGRSLPVFYGDHGLHGSLSMYREFHIAADILVQYERDDIERIITISKIGTHSELFGS